MRFMWGSTCWSGTHLVGVPALNGVVNFGTQKLKQRRAGGGNKPACFWMAGIVPSAWTTLPDTGYMKAAEVCHPCRGNLRSLH
eukprot:8589815-Heterocapsa_arctica.AAC.1